MEWQKLKNSRTYSSVPDTRIIPKYRHISEADHMTIQKIYRYQGIKRKLQIRFPVDFDEFQRKVGTNNVATIRARLRKLGRIIAEQPGV